MSPLLFCVLSFVGGRLILCFLLLPPAPQFYGSLLQRRLRLTSQQQQDPSFSLPIVSTAFRYSSWIHGMFLLQRNDDPRRTGTSTLFNPDPRFGTASLGRGFMSIGTRVFPYRTSYHHTIIQCKPNLNSSIQDNFTATNTRRNLSAWLVQQTEGLGDRDARKNQRTKETGMRG